ncbi:MAG: two-component system, cell cycle sensor histidine kinase and response regulator CckA [Acidobacteriota bacterium]|jgi:PAS domain S-box-containing protein|nr:two-component system, cell cycle sensor histidine kinase and response regulator CckA [Acidobacteriota bacterium]
MKFEAITARVRALKTDLLWGTVSLAVLLACLYYSYVAVFPQFDFAVSPNWEVFTAQTCPPGLQCLRFGDRLLSIGGVDFERFRSSRSVDLLSGIRPDGRTTVRVLRGGKVLSFPLQTHIPGKQESLLGTLPFALPPLIFWLMGVVAVVLLRPRDERWLIFVLFSFVTSLWLATGVASPRHTGGAGIVFHIIIWFFLPLAVHLHTILPSSRISRGMRAALLGPLYLAALVLAVLDADPRRAMLSIMLGWALAAVLLSAAILLLRLLLTRNTAVKVANRTMLFGMLFSLVPYICFFEFLPAFLLRLQITDIRGLFPWVSALSAPLLLLVPITYIYAIYKHHLGALEFRANRLVGAYSFSALAILSFVAVLLGVSSRWTIDVQYLSSVILVAVCFAVSTPYLRGRFQALVDRHVFGIRHTQEEVIGIVSERIPTAFDRAVLARVITDEILPTLLIRQSALYLFADGVRETLYEQALPPGEPAPTVEELAALLARGGRYIPPSRLPSEPARPRSWVLLAVPLALQAKAIGVWLIGRRDPDDYYPVSDVRLLSTVANQIAPMVENIRLYERAQQEIAQRKTAEREIRRSEERFRNLFEATLEGIAIVRDGRILEVNHALLAIFGCTASELIGRDLSDLVSDGEAILHAEPREGIGWKSDRTPVEIEIAGKKYVFQGEDVTVVAIRDIARRKRDEAENKMLQRQLLLSQKMEAIGRLSAGVAHDFNNCLLAIFGYSDLLLERYEDDPFLGRNLAGIKDAGQKAASLTKQLLAFARRQPMEKRVMDLNAVVSGVEKMLQRLLGEDVALLTDLSPTLARIKIDPGQMEQVIVNLAVNARQAMPSGGRLVIRTAPLTVALGRPAPHSDVPAGSYVVLTVIDTGIGMDPETQQRIFEPFFSTKGEGTGLGLSTAYGIVRQSGGNIFVDSAPGQGTCFSVYLPATAERESAGAGETASGPDSGTETILLVEDEEEARTVLRQILAGKGYRVLAAASGDEALMVAGELREAIDLLLTDVTMPRMKGPELASRLLPGRPQMRVIYMSGYNEEPLLGGEGAPLCLQKPFSAQTLARAVRGVLDAAEGLARAV